MEPIARKIIFFLTATMVLRCLATTKYTAVAKRGSRGPTVGAGAQAPVSPNGGSAHGMVCSSIFCSIDLKIMEHVQKKAFGGFKHMAGTLLAENLPFCANTTRAAAWHKKLKISGFRQAE